MRILQVTGYKLELTACLIVRLIRLLLVFANQNIVQIARDETSRVSCAIEKEIQRQSN